MLFWTDPVIYHMIQRSLCFKLVTDLWPCIYLFIRKIALATGTWISWHWYNTWDECYHLLSLSLIKILNEINQSFTPSSGRNSHSFASPSLPVCHHHLSLGLSLVVVSMAERSRRIVQCNVPPSMAALFRHHDHDLSISVFCFSLQFQNHFVKISITTVPHHPKQSSKFHLQV